MRLDVEYWRGRAKEARAVADRFQDPRSWQIMMAIAEGYEQMAKAAERLVESAAVLRNLTTMWPQERMRQANTVVRAPIRRRSWPPVRVMLEAAPTAPLPPGKPLRPP